MVRRLSCATALLLPLAPIIAHAQTAPVDVPEIKPQVDDKGVDLVTGTYNTNITDLSIGPKGEGGLSYTRAWTINGWRDLFSSGIDGSTSNPVVTLNGASESFTLSNGTYTSDQGTGATLVAQANGSYVYTSRTGVVANFSNIGSTNYRSSLGQVTSIRYSDGQTQKFSYATQTVTFTYIYTSTTTYARLRSVINSSGYMLHFDYKSNTATLSNNDWSTITKITANNNNIESCSPSADSCSFSRAWPSATYSYSQSYYPISSVNDAMGRATNYAVNLDKNTGVYQLTGIERPGANTNDVAINYDSNDLVVGVSKVGSTWSYARQSGQTNATDPANNTRIVLFNTSTGLITTDQNEAGKATSYQYDGNGRLTTILAPEGNAITYIYDGRGNVTSTTYTPKGNSGQSTLTTSAGFDGSCGNSVTCNSPHWTKDANGNETDYSYDPTHGGVTTVTSPAGANNVRPQVQFGYSAYADYFGNTIYLPVSSTTCRTAQPGSCGGNSDQNVTNINYGSLSGNNLLPVSITRQAGDGSVSSTVSMAYDAVGNVASTTDPIGAQTQYTYDADREKIEAISADPDGGGPLRPRAVRLSYNADGTVAQTEVGTDTGNNFQSLQQVVSGYDGYGRKVQDTVTANGITFGVTQYGYDGMGRLLCSTVRMNAGAFGSLPGACTMGSQGSDGPDRITLNNYDALSRLSSVVSGYGSNVQATVAATTFTPNGKVQTATDANGNQTSYAYDGFDRLVTTTYPDGSNEQLSYDSNGNKTGQRLRDGGYITYGYDALNRLTVAYLPGGGNGANPSYTYDNVGNLLSATNGNGQFNTQVYRYWDALGRMTTEVNQHNGISKTMQLQYDAAGRRARMTWADGFVESFSYDALGELTGISERSGYVPISFGYDDLGRRTVLNRSNGPGTTYSYDAASRLTGVAQTGSPNVSWGFGYNAGGQITLRTTSNDAYAWSGAVATSRSYTTNNLNQYTQSGSVSLGYDGRGNLAASGNTGYAYDALNQLGQSGNIRLDYDALGRLSYDTGSNIWHEHDGGQVVTEYDGSGNVLRRYLMVPGSDEPLIWYEGSDTTNRRFLHTDERGSVVAITDNSGNLSNINTYDEFGIPGQNNVGLYQYTGQTWIASLGLYDYKARTYSPTLGRFMQPDPIGYADGMNWYNYVGGDPVNLVDPKGLWHLEWRSFAVDDGEGGVIDEAYAVSVPDPGDLDNLGPHSNTVVPDGQGGYAGPEITVTAQKQQKVQPTPKPQCSITGDVIALGFDAAGFLAGFTPGGDAAVALVQIAVGVGATSNSGAGHDNVGIGLGTAGIGAALVTPAARATGVLAKAIPGIGAGIAVLSTLHDAKGLYDHLNGKCD